MNLHFEKMHISKAFERYPLIEYEATEFYSSDGLFRRRQVILPRDLKEGVHYMVNRLKDPWGRWFYYNASDENLYFFYLLPLNSKMFYALIREGLPPKEALEIMAL